MRLYEVPHPDAIRLHGDGETGVRRDVHAAASAAAADSSSAAPAALLGDDVEIPGVLRPAAPIALQLVPAATFVQVSRTPTCLRWCPHTPGRLYVGTSDGSIIILDAAAWLPSPHRHLSPGDAMAGGASGGPLAATAVSSIDVPSRSDLGFVLTAAGHAAAAAGGGAAAAAALCKRLHGVWRWSPAGIIGSVNLALTGASAGAVRALAISPASPRLLASAHSDSYFRMWDVLGAGCGGTGGSAGSGTMPLVEAACYLRLVTSMDFLPRRPEMVIAAGDTGEIALLDTQHPVFWRPIVSLPAHPAASKTGTGAAARGGAGSGGGSVLRPPTWDVRCLSLCSMIRPTVRAIAGTAGADAAGAADRILPRSLVSDTVAIVAAGDGGCSVVPLLSAEGNFGNADYKSLHAILSGSAEHIRSMAAKSAATPAIGRSSASAAKLKGASGGTGDKGKDGKQSPGLDAVDGEAASGAGKTGRGGKDDEPEVPVGVSALVRPWPPSKDHRQLGLTLTPPLPPLGCALAGGADLHPSAAAVGYAPRLACHRARLLDVGGLLQCQGLALAVAGYGNGTVQVRLIDLAQEMHAASAIPRMAAAARLSRSLVAGTTASAIAAATATGSSAAGVAAAGER